MKMVQRTLRVLAVMVSLLLWALRRQQQAGEPWDVFSMVAASAPAAGSPPEQLAVDLGRCDGCPVSPAALEVVVGALEYRLCPSCAEKVA